MARPITALFPFGRSGSLFFQSLFDGHPNIVTLPGVYFQEWYGLNQWKRFAPKTSNPDWRQRLADQILQDYQPLFDARSKRDVPGRPFGRTDWLARDSGFMDMGADCSQPFEVDQVIFKSLLLSLLAPLSSIGQKDCFELLHRAFDLAVRGNAAASAGNQGEIFYHIHSPTPFALAHFLQHYPQAKLLQIMRNPVQSMESWMMDHADNIREAVNGESAGHSGQRFETNDKINSWSKMVSKSMEMLTQMQLPFYGLAHGRGVRLEDIKRNPRKIMPQIAAWIGVPDDPALYETSFCGLQYWGPASKSTGSITGFDTKAIDQRVGRLLGLRDILIFETLFWPLSHLYSYTGVNVEGFRRQLAEIRPWLNEPLEFEMRIYEALPDHSRSLKELHPYIRLHQFLHRTWSVLDRNGTYHGMVQPLELE